MLSDTPSAYGDTHSVTAQSSLSADLKEKSTQWNWKLCITNLQLTSQHNTKWQLCLTVSFLVKSPIHLVLVLLSCRLLLYIPLHHYSFCLNGVICVTAFLLTNWKAARCTIGHCEVQSLYEAWRWFMCFFPLSLSPKCFHSPFPDQIWRYSKLKNDNALWITVR